MPGARRAALAVLAGLAAACGAKVEGPSVVAIVELHRAAPERLPADRIAPCVVEGSGDPNPFSSFPVFASPGDPAPIAVVLSGGDVPLRFTEWPSYETGGRAAVTIEGNRVVRMNGFVLLSERRFQLKKRLDLVEPNLFAEVGTVVSVRGAHEGGLFVDVRTPFAEPRTVGLAVPCDGLAYENKQLATRTAPADLPKLETRSPTLTFYAAPDGRAVFNARVGEGRIVSVVEQRGGFTHVLFGDEPAGFFPGGTLMVDAWVPEDAVGPITPSGDRDTNCGIPDSYDHCSDDAAFVREDTPLRLGSKGPVIGTVEAGASVETGERADGHVAIELVFGVFGAPPGQSFFVSEAAVEPCRDSRPDGCSCTVQ